MYSYYISFLALSGPISFRAATTDEETITKFIFDFLTLFSEVNEEQNEAKVKILQQNSPEIVQSITELVAKYAEKIPQMNALSAYFRRLKEGEYFFFIPKEDLKNIDTSPFNIQLIALSENKTFEEIKEEMSLFDEVRSNYNLTTFGQVRHNIGEWDKSKRVCRFCNNNPKNGESLSFDNKAHAISEALGNKKIVLYDECDSCNSRFARTIEPDMVLFVSLFRTYFKIQAKGGIKDFKDKKFEIRNDEHFTIEYKSDTPGGEFSLPYSIELKSSKSFTRQNVYKTFVKYFLSVIDSDQLPYFRKTIEWINGDYHIDELPRIAELLSYHAFTQEPKMMVYIRKSDNRKLPYGVCEFSFAALVYVFIIPACSEDELTFIDKEEFHTFWSTFKHYSRLPNWQYLNLSSNNTGTFSLQLNFEKSSNSNLDKDN